MEEYTSSDGHHVTKVIHQEKGLTLMNITRDDETPGDPLNHIGGPMDAL
jgi:hypothetical protein